MSGSGTYYTSAVTSRDPSTTNTTQRTVSDVIREMWPESAPMFAITAKGSPKDGKVGGKGLIGKETTKTHKFEWYTFTPIGLVFTVSSGSNLSPVVSTADGLRPQMTLVNLTNMHVAVIDAINSTTLTLIAITSSFTCAVADRLLVMAPTYKQGSTDPQELSKDEDHTYNYIYNYRFAVSIARTAKTDPHYGKEDYFSRLKRRSVVHGKRLLENSLLFMERAASGGTTSTTSLGNVYSTRGAWNWAQKTFPCGGAMTPEKFMKDLPLAMNDTVNDDDELLFLCGNHIFADIQSWWWDKLQLQKPGMYEKIGIKTVRILTAGPTIHIMKHSAFNQIGNQTRGIIFKPDNLTWMHKAQADMQPEYDIQDNDEHTYRDGIWGTIGLKVEDGGYEIMKVTGWNAPGAV